jgi:hypothetical protein
MKKIFFVLCFIVMNYCSFAQIVIAPRANSFGVLFSASPLKLQRKMHFSEFLMPFPYNYYTYQTTGVFYSPVAPNGKIDRSPQENFYRFRNDTLSMNKNAQGYYQNEKPEKYYKPSKFLNTLNTVLMYLPF